VVLNSVAQYFPSTDYLRDVLADAVRVVAPGGAIFVGDVRGVEMLPEFHTSVTLHRAPVLHPLEEVRSTVARQVRDEPELCLSPAFFHKLVAGVPGAGEVRVELKPGRDDNELTAFRYDVTILVGDRPVEPPATRAEWSDLADLAEVLAATTEPVRVHGVPNRRLVRPVAAVRALASMPVEATVWDLDRLLWETDEAAAPHPEDIVALAERAGRAVRLLVPSDGRLDKFDVLFARYEEGQ